MSDEFEEANYQESVKIPQETLAAFGGDELRARVFYEKYALRDPDGKQVEKLPQEMWRRIAKAMASVEKEPNQKEWEEKFYWLLENYRISPGGRIMFAAGNPRKATLTNCYVAALKDDSLAAIMDWCKDAALTYARGGGIGVDLSPLRPKGSLTSNSSIRSTGSVSFMELMSTVTGTVGQGSRRGALMISIGIEHPDSPDFVEIKRDLGKVKFANVSLRITDAFMNAVRDDRDFTLHFENEKVKASRAIRAKDLWQKIVKAAWESDEPGILYWDTVKRGSTTEYNGCNVVGTNPCSEEPMESGGACCLGSLNLSAFVSHPFTDQAAMDWGSLTKAIGYAVRFLDDVVDYNADRHALPEQREQALKTRRIGLGVTGLADALIKLRMKYDDEQAVNTVSSFFERLRDAAYKASIEIAKEKGSFPAFDAEKHLAQPFVQRLPQEIKDDILASGLRNMAILTMPPVGSGSVLAGTSSGIEPVFAYTYTRRSESLSAKEYTVLHPLVKEYMDSTGVKEISDVPSYFVAAHQIDPMMRVKMQAAIQQNTDQAVSSTINLPREATVEEVEKIYFAGWEAGLKGVTIYREGSRVGILETEEEAERKRREGGAFERPRTMEGKTTQVRVAEGNLYVTLNYEDGKPVEAFIHLGKGGTTENAGTEAIGRLISIFLQRGGTVEEVTRVLKGINSGLVMWDEGMRILSIPDGISRGLDILTGNGKKRGDHDLGDGKLLKCPRCHEETLRAEGGCFVCDSCGYSKCE